MPLDDLSADRARAVDAEKLRKLCLRLLTKHDGDQELASADLLGEAERHSWITNHLLRIGAGQALRLAGFRSRDSLWTTEETEEAAAKGRRNAWAAGMFGKIMAGYIVAGVHRPIGDCYGIELDAAIAIHRANRIGNARSEAFLKSVRKDTPDDKRVSDTHDEKSLHKKMKAAKATFAGE